LRRRTARRHSVITGPPGAKSRLARNYLLASLLPESKPQPLSLSELAPAIGMNAHPNCRAAREASLQHRRNRSERNRSPPPSAKRERIGRSSKLGLLPARSSPFVCPLKICLRRRKKHSASSPSLGCGMTLCVAPFTFTVIILHPRLKIPVNAHQYLPSIGTRRIKSISIVQEEV